LERLAAEIGRALRRARRERGLTLREASRLSGGRFKPTSLAGYERAERSIPLERFCELASLYGVEPDRLLASAVRAWEGRPELVVDVARATSIGGPEGRMLATFVQEIIELRGETEAEAEAEAETEAETVTIRAADLEILASASGRTPAAVYKEIRRLLRSSAEPQTPRR